MLYFDVYFSLFMYFECLGFSKKLSCLCFVRGQENLKGQIIHNLFVMLSRGNKVPERLFAILCSILIY